MGPENSLFGHLNYIIVNDSIYLLNADQYLHNSGRVTFNRKKKGTTVLLDKDEKLALVRCLDGVKFDLRKGVSYAVLRWLGMGGNDIWNDFQSFTYIKTTHKGKKKQRVIFSEDFLKYLIVKGFRFTREELDILYEQILDPDTYDPEQLFLDLLLTKRYSIKLETIDKLISEAQEHGVEFLDGIPDFDETWIEKHNKTSTLAEILKGE